MTYVIAVSGPAGAGKTALLHALAAALPDAAAVFMDAYETMTLNSPASMRAWLQAGSDIDAFDFSGLERDLERLRAGRPIEDPASGRVSGPAKYVLLETHFGRAHRATGRLIDLMIWIDTPLDVALARNVRTFIAAFPRGSAAQLAERVDWMQGYLDAYLDVVRSMLLLQKARVAPGADLTSDGLGSPQAMAQALLPGILERLP
jgi:uridine kinase